MAAYLSIAFQLDSTAKKIMFFLLEKRHFSSLIFFRTKNIPSFELLLFIVVFFFFVDLLLSNSSYNASKIQIDAELHHAEATLVHSFCVAPLCKSSEPKTKESSERIQMNSACWRQIIIIKKSTRNCRSLSTSSKWQQSSHTVNHNSASKWKSVCAFLSPSRYVSTSFFMFLIQTTSHTHTYLSHLRDSTKW